MTIPHDREASREVVEAWHAFSAVERPRPTIWEAFSAGWKAALSRPVGGVEGAARRLLPYLDWTLGPESPGHHPTLPSAVAALRTALEGGGGEGLSSDHGISSASACLPTESGSDLERMKAQLANRERDPNEAARRLAAYARSLRTEPGLGAHVYADAIETLLDERAARDGLADELQAAASDLLAEDSESARIHLALAINKTQAALTSPPSVGGGNQGISSELTATSSGAVLAQGDFAIDRAWIDGARYARNCLEADNHQKLNDAIDGRQKEISAALAAANGPNGATAPPPDHGQLSQQNQSPPLPKEPGR
jgi:hypothetical protein